MNRNNKLLILAVASYNLILLTSFTNCHKPLTLGESVQAHQKTELTPTPQKPSQVPHSELGESTPQHTKMSERSDTR